MPTTKHRIAINLEDDEFADLADMADKHDVSLAWIGRQAVLQFISRYRNQQLPLPLRFNVQQAKEVVDVHNA
jgi:predicted transcriptional regulator